MKVPIYRAKRIDSDEYVEGYFYPMKVIGTNKTEPYIASDDLNDPQYDDWFAIDPSTLAIHFPDMLDSEGTKIFASLSEDGKGGDEHNRWHGKSGWVMYDGLTIFDISAGSDTSDYEVTGIQE